MLVALRTVYTLLPTATWMEYSFSWGAARPLASFLASRGRVRTLLACQASGLAVNLLVNAALIPELGAKGAAIASLSSYAFDSVLLWVMFVRRVESRESRVES